MSIRSLRRPQSTKSAEGNNRTIDNFEEFSSEQNYDSSAVTDIAKGFAEAQANIINNSAGCNKEILNLLQKVTSQLDNLQFSQGSNQLQQESGTTSTGTRQENSEQPQEQLQQQSVQKFLQNQQQQSGQKQSGQQPQGSSQGQQAGSEVAQQLQELFSKVLLNNNTLQNKNSQASVNNPNLESSNKTNKTTAMAVQTASQVLAKAQYELANELEASLEKLKQVISESEKIANQISTLLGESSNKKS